MRASETSLRKAVYRSRWVLCVTATIGISGGLIGDLYFTRVKDWLYGVIHTQPESNSDESVEPQSDAERLRTVYNMITLPENEGGADIIPKYGEWENVESIFPLHDNETNKEWIRSWSTKTLLSKEELDQIRDKLGESVGVLYAPCERSLRLTVKRSGSISPSCNPTLRSLRFLQCLGFPAGYSSAISRLYTLS